MVHIRPNRLKNGGFCDIIRIAFFVEERAIRIAIDIDDTLTDSFEYFIPFVAEYFRTDERTLREKNISYSTLPEEWKPRELDFCKAYYDKVVPDTFFKKNAVYYVNKLHGEGHGIIIITARTKEMYTDPYKTTKEELDKNGLCYDEIVCTMDKTRACKEREIELFIDDSVGNCEAVEKTGTRTLLFSGQGNGNRIVPFERVDSWEGVYRRVQELTEGMSR